MNVNHIKKGNCVCISAVRLKKISKYESDERRLLIIEILIYAIISLHGPHLVFVVAPVHVVSMVVLQQHIPPGHAPVGGHVIPDDGDGVG